MIGALVAATLLPISVLAQTDVALTSGTPVANLSGGSGSQTYYRIEVPAGTTQLIVTTSGGTGDVDVYVRRGSRPIPSVYDAAGISLTTAENVVIINPVAGTYYILLLGYSGYSGVTLRATASTEPPTDDHGNTTASATTITLNSSTNGRIDHAGDIDFFRVQVTEAGTLTIFTTGSTDTYGRLLDSNGIELASNDDASGIDLNFRIVRTVSAGTYFVSVRHFSGAESGAYVLRVDFTTGGGGGGGTDDHGNTSATATTVTPNSSTNGTLSPAGDVDFFRVQVTSAGTLTIFTTGSTDTMGRLIDSSGVELANNDDFLDLNFRIVRTVAAGTYFIEVRHYSSAGTGAYVLRVDFTGTPSTTDDHGNTTATATAVALNSSTNGAINTPGDVDYFRLQVTGPGTLTVYTTGPTDTVGSLHDANGVTLTTNDDFIDLNFRIVREVTAGTYFVSVRHFSSGAIGAYVLRVDFSTGGGSGGTDLHGNTRATAADVALGSSTNAAINFPGDIDYFRVVLPTAGTLTIYTTGSTDTYGRLLDANGVELAVNDDSADLNFRISRMLSAGTYYIEVRHYSPLSTGAYILRVESSASAPGSRVANFSIRSSTGPGSQSLIVGFVLTGGANEQILVRSIGPALFPFGVTNVLADPTLQLFSGATAIASNDNWGGDSAVRSATTLAGAFGLPESSRDAALVRTLGAGSYAAQVGGGAGITLVEVYNLGSTGLTRLTNVSARTQVGSGADIMIAGFVITGQGQRTVLIRAVGPSLAQFGVTGALADPRLEVFGGSASIATNDNWGGTPTLSSAFAQTGAFGLPADSRDAAVLLSLQPGSYTAHVSGVGGTTGVALLEVYEMP